MLLILISIGCGLAGAFVRSFELDKVYDAETGLAVSGHPLTLLLIAITAATAALLLLLLRGQSHAPSKTVRLSALAPAGLILFIAGSYDTILAATSSPASLARLLMAVLTAVAGLAVLYPVVASLLGRPCGAYHFSFVIPIFWGCFHLVNTFFAESSNPVVVSFMYGLFADIALLLALYYTAGLYFGRRHTLWLRLSGGMTIYFSLITLLGPPLFQLLAEGEGRMPDLHYIKNDGGWSDIAVLCFAILFGLSALATDERVGAPREDVAADELFE